jgi:cytochrome c-type biogenesis protein CcmF
MDAPIFSRPDYLSFITDGNGLNPLLQNYWMVIHPPTLFLGFAATLVPFAYSIASLWKNDWNGWVKPVLPWSLFATMTLGAGILMGGAWAYEALSFGGFWAWDPVENASLVPWLTLVAGLHTVIIYKSTGQALRAAYLFFIATFLLILYSTFLTRSGILGDTSVHSFTDLGMSGQLVFFIAFFMLLSLVILGMYWKKIPNPQKEEQLSSREFWMFIGALVLTISAIQITFTTSIPVWNKFFHLFRKLPAIGQFFNKDLAPPVNAVQHYNSVQVWIAIMISIGSGYVQYLRYKHSNIRQFLINIAPSVLASVIFSVPAAIMLEITLPHYMLMFVACMFAIIANTQYVIVSLKGKLKSAGASVAHAGFGLLLLGALISQHNQEVISVNTSGIDFGDSFDKKSKIENILLRRDEPVKMGDYDVTYIGDSVVSPNHYYKVRYKRFDEEGNLKEEFTLLPNAQINKNMGLVSSPDTRHYLTKDIYTHVTSVPNKEKIEQELTKYVPDTIAVGDTFYTAKAFVIAERLIPGISVPGWEKTENDISVGLRLRAHTLDDQTYHATPVYLIRNNMPFSIADSIPELGIAFRIEKILPEKGLIVLGKKEKDFENDFIIMKAIVFPYINLLWLGCIVMLTGFVISMRRRISENK